MSDRLRDIEMQQFLEEEIQRQERRAAIHSAFRGSLKGYAASGDTASVFDGASAPDTAATLPATNTNPPTLPIAPATPSLPMPEKPKGF